MHIPKTAGTSAHAAFSKHYAPWRIPRNFRHARGQPDRFEKYDFLGGHFGYEQFLLVAAKYGVTENHKSITFVRKPIEQLASHLAWNRHISEPGKEHRIPEPPVFVALSKKLRSIDFSSPAELSEYLGEMKAVPRALFDNCIVRYFTTVKREQHVSEAHLEKALENFDAFDAVGVVERYDESMRAISNAVGWSKPSKTLHRNANPNRYGLDLSNPEIRDVLEPHVRFDNVIYERACARLDALANDD